MKFRLLVSAAALGLVSAPSMSATVIHGTSNGNTIAFDSSPLGQPFQAGKTKISFDITGGNFISGMVSLALSHSYSIFYSYPPYSPDIDYGNNDSDNASCSFGAGPIACVNDFGEPTGYLSDFLVGPNHLEFIVNQPRSFDKCGNVYNVICMEKWSSILGGEFHVTNPVRYKVTYNNLSAVPEPASWAMMIAGFGLVGALTRKHRRRIQREVLA